MWSLMASSHWRCSAVKTTPCCCLLGQPLLIPLLHRAGDGDQRLVRVEGVAHQGDHVHQFSAALALHRLRLRRLVGLPDPLRASAPSGGFLSAAASSLTCRNRSPAR